MNRVTCLLALFAFAAPAHSAQVYFPGRAVTVPVLLPNRPMPIVSIKPQISLPSPVNPMVIAPSLVLAPSLVIVPAAPVRAAAIAAPSVEIVVISALPSPAAPAGGFYPAVRKTLGSRSGTPLTAAKLDALFDGVEKPEPAPVSVPSQKSEAAQEEPASPVTDSHMTLPEQDLASEIGF